MAHDPAENLLEKLLAVPEVDQISFSGEEKKILDLWQKLDAFQSCLKQSKDKPRYMFYDGPPFATGLPHYGHILTGTIKDVVTRWAHQNGFHVDRRFGWDTHGLPVEYEIDKTHGIRGPEDVAAMGIKKYNELCRGIVMRYADQWEEIVTRLGRWIDFKNDYKTLYPSFMESVWWVFSQLYQKGLVYRGVKVMPFSTACSTPLSNFEAGQNYKDVQDPSVVVTFPLKEENGVSFVAWTTTPWTLPSNLALCVNPREDYVRVKGKVKDRTGMYILMEARLCQLFKHEADYEVLGKMKGKELEGKQYVPLFDYYKEHVVTGAFKVVCDAYVTSESGTGVVHQAPYFGEDDFRVCLGYGIISRDQEPVCPVDDAGRFTAVVKDFVSQHVKEADKEIIKHLRGNGRLVLAETVNHSYPFCWRSDTPLIYRAVPSWFVRVEHMQEKLLGANEKTYWVPTFVKEKRFANWLREARDWAISRKRYWGTPIPLWVSHDFEEVVCIGSVAELEALSGQKVTDLHRENIDHIMIPSSRPGQPPLKRIDEVFDCWFESGSMPYAQVHYPFENKREFEDSFPADFIAEGIDQTRGWFYTLLVVSTALFGRPPFKNLIVNGLVLAEDGQKMSKRKQNYPDPLEVVNKYGADALRLYLMNSPAVRGENLRFKESDVFSLLKEVFIPWLNAYRFFVQHVELYEKASGDSFLYDESLMGHSLNVMDQWIISFTQSLLQFVHKQMNEYRLYNVTPRLVKFVDNLTNWYVRFNRGRLKGKSGENDNLMALETLFSVLYCMVRIMAPFTPFITEMMYQNMKKVIKKESLGKQQQGDTSSVHYLMMPQAREDLIRTDIESCVALLQSAVEAGRYLRDKVNLPMKYPLPEVVVIMQAPEELQALSRLENYLKEELNVRTVTLSGEKEKYGVTLKAEVNFKALGSRLKGDLKKVQQYVALMKEDEVLKVQKQGQLEVFGHSIPVGDLIIKYIFGSDTTGYAAHSDGRVLVLLDTTPSEEMVQEGVIREVVNRVQKLRKKAKLMPWDEVIVWYGVPDTKSDLARLTGLPVFAILLEQSVGMIVMKLDELTQFLTEKEVIIRESLEVKGTKLELAITRMFGHEGINGGAKGITAAPLCPWVNLCSVTNGSNLQATLLLENPVGTPVLKTVKDVREEALWLFGYEGKNIQVKCGQQVLNDNESLGCVGGKMLTITLGDIDELVAKMEVNMCRFINIEGNGKKGTVLLENPKGQLAGFNFPELCRRILGLMSSSKLKFYSDPEGKRELLLNESSALEKLASCTVYVQ